MSGLRETIRRRGGLELTSRVVGGLWVVGQRTVPLATPYNAAATAALMAQFPSQWPTIRDYGWQHEEIVPWVNAYPMGMGYGLAYYGDAIVAGINNKAYHMYDGHTCFQTPWMHTLQSSMEGDIIATAANTWAYFWGAEDTGDGPTGLSMQRRQSGPFRGTVNGKHQDYNINCVLNQKYHIWQSRYELYIDGNNIPHGSGTPTAPTIAHMVIAGLRTGNTMQADGWCHIGRLYPIKWREGEELAHYLLPAADNKLLDVVTNTELTPYKGTGAILNIESPA